MVSSVDKAETLGGAIVAGDHVALGHLELGHHLGQILGGHGEGQVANVDHGVRGGTTGAAGTVTAAALVVAARRALLTGNNLLGIDLASVQLAVLQLFNSPVNDAFILKGDKAVALRAGTAEHNVNVGTIYGKMN